MRNIAGNRVFNMILLFTIIGEFIVPWILERFYSEYNGKIMVMSVLGSPQSPVRLVYNIWLMCILFVIKSKVSCSGGFHASFDWNFCCWCRTYFWIF